MNKNIKHITREEIESLGFVLFHEEKRTAGTEQSFYFNRNGCKDYIIDIFQETDTASNAIGFSRFGYSERETVFLLNYIKGFEELKSLLERTRCYPVISNFNQPLPIRIK
jgi:hypothetical protein